MTANKSNFMRYFSSNITLDLFYMIVLLCSFCCPCYFDALLLTWDMSDCWLHIHYLVLNTICYVTCFAHTETVHLKKVNCPDHRAWNIDTLYTLYHTDYHTIILYQDLLCILLYIILIVVYTIYTGLYWIHQVCTIYTRLYYT